MNDEMLMIGDRRHRENEAGQFDLTLDSDLMAIHTGGADYHKLVFLREGAARKLYEQLSRVFDEDNSSNSTTGDAGE